MVRKMLRGRILACVGVVVLAVLSTGSLSASLIQDLIYANDPAVMSGVPSGSIFGTVSVSATSSNTVKFVLDANQSVLTPGTNFGIQKFGFEYDASLTGEITITGLPAGWTVVEDKSMDGFGKFEIVNQGTGQTRTDPLSFSVTTSNSFGSGGDLEQAFFKENELGFHFAAHIAGFQSINGVTSAYFTDGIPIPEAATILLFSSGIAAVVALRRKARRGSRLA